MATKLCEWQITNSMGETSSIFVPIGTVRFSTKRGEKTCGKFNPYKEIKMKIFHSEFVDWFKINQREQEAKESEIYFDNMDVDDRYRHAEGIPLNFEEDDR